MIFRLSVLIFVSNPGQNLFPQQPEQRSMCPKNQFNSKHEIFKGWILSWSMGDVPNNKFEIIKYYNTFRNVLTDNLIITYFMLIYVWKLLSIKSISSLEVSYTLVLFFDVHDVCANFFSINMSIVDYCKLIKLEEKCFKRKL